MGWRGGGIGPGATTTTQPLCSGWDWGSAVGCPSGPLINDHPLPCSVPQFPLWEHHPPTHCGLAGVAPSLARSSGQQRQLLLGGWDPEKEGGAWGCWHGARTLASATATLWGLGHVTLPAQEQRSSVCGWVVGLSQKLFLASTGREGVSRLTGVAGLRPGSQHLPAPTQVGVREAPCDSCCSGPYGAQPPLPSTPLCL